MFKIFFLAITFIFIACDPYEVKLSEDTLVMNGENFKYNACMINKLSDVVYSVELSGLKDDNTYLKASILIEKALDNSSTKITDVWLDGTKIDGLFFNTSNNHELLDISENSFSVKTNFIDSENNLTYKLEATCNVEASSDYPKVIRDGKKVSSNVACSAYEVPEDRLVVISTITFQTKVLFLNNILTNEGNRGTYAEKYADGSYSIYYGGLEENSDIRGDILTLIYEHSYDDKLRYEVECKLGKTTRK